MSGSGKLPAEFNPQHRIVGAVILVILAIIILPIILNEKQLTTQGVGNEITLSEKDSKIYVSRAKDILRAQKMKSKTGSASSIENNTSHPQKDTTKAKPVVSHAEEKAAPTNKPDNVVEKKKKVSSDSKSAQKITKGWIVQIGTYSDPANAKKVRASLVRRGYHVRLEKIKLSKGDATRVRVGPFSDRGKAITTLSHIGRDVGLQGVVLRYP